MNLNFFAVDGRASVKRLAASLLVSMGAGAVGALFSKDSKKIYGYLKLPPFAPPAQVFPVVWTVLFVLMGLAAYRVWMRGGKARPEGGVKSALSYYLIQLIFNVLWSTLFFWLQLYEAAFADLMILLLYILVTTVRFLKIDRAAGWMMVPYAAWVAFAAALNLAVIVLN